MAKEVRCDEIEYFPDCEGVVRGETEDEVLAGVAQHGKEVHGMRDEDIDQSAIDKVRASMRDAV